MRRALVVALVALAMPVLPAAPAGAETTVAHNGNVVTITVRVDVYGAGGLTGPDGTTPLIDYWEGTVNARGAPPSTRAATRTASSSS